MNGRTNDDPDSRPGLHQLLRRLGDDRFWRLMYDQFFSLFLLPVLLQDCFDLFFRLLLFLCAGLRVASLGASSLSRRELLLLLRVEHGW